MVISVIGTADRPLELHKLFTKTAGAVLDQTQFSGVDILSDQYLLLPKGFYVAAARNLLNGDALPLYCWIYFGMQQKDGRSGLHLRPERVRNARNGNCRLRQRPAGRTCRLVRCDLLYREMEPPPERKEASEGLEDLKLPVVRSKAAYLEGETLKLAY